MTTFKKFTVKDYREAVAKAKAEGNKVVERLWDGIRFEQFTIRFVEEVK